MQESAVKLQWAEEKIRQDNRLRTDKRELQLCLYLLGFVKQDRPSEWAWTQSKSPFLSLSVWWLNKTPEDRFSHKETLFIPSHSQIITANLSEKPDCSGNLLPAPHSRSCLCVWIYYEDLKEPNVYMLHLGNAVDYHRQYCQLIPQFVKANGKRACSDALTMEE